MKNLKGYAFDSEIPPLEIYLTDIFAHVQNGPFIRTVTVAL